MTWNIHTHEARLLTFRAWLFGGFATAALVICAVGIVGIIAMSAARRTRELGIRIALGATRPEVVGLFLREHLVPVAIGLIVGGFVSFWAVQFVHSYLFRFSVYDLRLWSLAAAAILASAALGAVIPAWRASRVDPIRALRTE
jgi:ABC-type antimicrobial peptide transport system permease subunit